MFWSAQTKASKIKKPRKSKIRVDCFDRFHHLRKKLPYRGHMKALSLPQTKHLKPLYQVNRNLPYTLRHHKLPFSWIYYLCQKSIKKLIRNQFPHKNWIFVISILSTMFDIQSIFKSRDIYDIISPFYHISKILGVAPFNIVSKQKKKTAKQTIPNCIWCLLHVLAYLGLVYKSIYIKENFRQTGSIILDNGFTFLLQFACCLMAFDLITNFFVVKKAFAVINDLNEFDIKVNISFLLKRLSVWLIYRSRIFHFQDSLFGQVKNIALCLKKRLVKINGICVW